MSSEKNSCNKTHWFFLGPILAFLIPQQSFSEFCQHFKKDLPKCSIALENNNYCVGASNAPTCFGSIEKGPCGNDDLTYYFCRKDSVQQSNQEANCGKNVPGESPVIIELAKDYDNVATDNRLSRCSATTNGVAQLLRKEKIQNLPKSPKDQYRKLLEVSFPAKKKGDFDSFMELFDDMTNKESELCENAAVFYTAGGYAGSFISEIRKCFPATESRKVDVVIQDLLKQVPKDKQKNFDRVSVVRANIISLSTSLLAMGPYESAVDLFMGGKNINVNTQQALKDIIGSLIKGDAEKAQKLQSLVEKYDGKISRSMIQIFVNKDSVDELVYLSKPFGLPTNLVAEQKQRVLETLAEGPEAFEAYASAKGGEVQRKMNAYKANYATADWGSRGYYNFLQARLLVTSTAFRDPNKVQKFAYYPKEEVDAVENLRKDINAICK